MDITPSYISIGKLFEQNILFEIPKYQRYYAWEDEQVYSYQVPDPINYSKFYNKPVKSSSVFVKKKPDFMRVLAFCKCLINMDIERWIDYAILCKRVL